MNRCNGTNQYYDDVVDATGNIIEKNCFEPGLYSQMKNFNFTDFMEYKNKDYYNYINTNFREYSFPENYKDLSFEDICETEEYSLKPQQKFVSRIFNTNTPSNGMIIFHGLGSGKTQTSIVVGESFKFRKVNSKIIPGRSDQRVLIVVPASLTEQYYLEIIGRLEGENIKSATGQVVIEGERQYYLNKKLRRTLDVITRNINRIEDQIEKLPEGSREYTTLQQQLILLRKQYTESIKEEARVVTMVYEIISHEMFLNQLYSQTFSESGDYLQKLGVSNGLLIIDEAHRLVSAVGTSYRKLLFALKYHSHPQFRVVLLSGSPIYDKPYEFGLMMNLLKPRIQFPDGEEDFNEVFLVDRKNISNKKIFETMVSGYVSYFKGGNPESYPYKKTVIMHHSMNPYQYSAYKKALLKEVEKDKKVNPDGKSKEFLIKMISSESKNDEISSSVFNNTRLFCNIAFPEILSPLGVDETIPVRGLNKFKSLLSAINGTSDSDELKKQRCMELIYNHSSKFGKVVELIEESEGPVFIYSNYVTYGVEAMAAVMYSLGYREYSHTRPNPEFKTYFIWKGGLNKKDVSRAKGVFDSEDNIRGKRIKILLGTQSVMEGVDFKRVRQVHVLDPWWNDSRMQQVIARAIRLCSHKGLPPDKRITDVFIHLSTLGASAEPLYSISYNDSNGIMKKGYSKMINKYPNPDAPKEYWFYNPAFIVDRSGVLSIIERTTEKIKLGDILGVQLVKDLELTQNFGEWKGLNTYSVEEYMYRTALRKLNINRQFEYSIKKVSIDCDINKYGNIVRLDEKYIPYSKKEYHYSLEYENYQTGKRYIRVGVKSLYDSSLPENILSLKDILENTAKNCGKYDFIEIGDSEQKVIKIQKSLIVPENIKCKIIDYSISGLPDRIFDNTINTKLSSYLMKIDITQLKKFLKDAEQGKIGGITDPELSKKIKGFYSKEALTEKEQIIKKLQDLGIADSDTPWDLETPENLKKLYRQLTGKKK